ncbi:MAG: glycoside hydrolase family 9 protein, partial [Butyrivibrio sp.]|nr:glycoside hydrolase family 9 protein [Butyrivibrio sp.]
MRIFFEGGKSKYVALVMAMSMCLGACGYKEENAPDDNIEEETVDNSNVDLSGIEYPVAMPNTLVDQVGYRTGAEKIVIFRGEELPETFDVVDAQTDEVVYTGVVRKSVYNEELDEYDSYGYFSDLQENGRYYIYTDLLGSSYEFEIKEYMYDEIFDAACKKYFANRCGIEVTQEYAGDDAHVNCHSKPAHLQEDPSKEIEVSGGWHLDSNADRYVYDGCLIAENLLLGYEMYPDQYGDDTGILESGNDIP